MECACARATVQAALGKSSGLFYSVCVCDSGGGSSVLFSTFRMVFLLGCVVLDVRSSLRRSDSEKGRNITVQGWVYKNKRDSCKRRNETEFCDKPRSGNSLADTVERVRFSDRSSLIDLHIYAKLNEDRAAIICWRTDRAPRQSCRRRRRSRPRCLRRLFGAWPTSAYPRAFWGRSGGAFRGFFRRGFWLRLRG